MATAAAAVSLALIAAPGVAHATEVATPTTSRPTAAQLRTELSAVAKASAAAEKAGWTARTSLHLGPLHLSQTAVRDLRHDRAAMGVKLGDFSLTAIGVAHRGVWSNLYRDAETRRALRLAGRPEARWVFAADPTLTFDDDAGDVGERGSQLVTDLRDALDPSTVLERVAPDGSRTYRAALVVDRDEPPATARLEVSSKGVLTRVLVRQADTRSDTHFGYGPQHVAVPAKQVTIRAERLERALEAVQLGDVVTHEAREAARELEATRRSSSHGLRTRQVRAVVRKVVRRTAREGDLTIPVQLTDAPYGSLITATNPFTHHQVAYRVQLVKMHAVARPGR